MRIAVVTESFLPTMNGVSNSVLRAVRHLETRGHEVLVVAPGPGGHTVGVTPVMRTRSHTLPMYADFPVGLSVRRLLARLSRFDPDVVHLASPIALGAVGLAAARSVECPTVAVYQTDVPAFARSYGFGWTASTLWRWLRLLHNRADLTLAPSTAAVGDLAAHGILRVAVWGRGVDLELFDPSRRSEALRSRWTSDRQLVVGYVGRLAPEKRLDLLAPVAAMAGVRLVIVGDGPDRSRLQRLLPGAVFTGFLGGSRLAAAFASFDTFVHTGTAETFCQTVQEALASGVPAIVPAAGGPLDLITSGHNGAHYRPGDGEDLRRSVGQLIVDPQRLRRWRGNARPSVEGRTWSAVGDELVAHYRAVVARSRNRAA